MPGGTGGFPLVIAHRGPMGAQVQALHSPSHTPHLQQRSAEVVHSRCQCSARRGGFPRTASQHRLLRVCAFLPAAGLPLGALGGPPIIPPLPQSRQKSLVCRTGRSTPHAPVVLYATDRSTTSEEQAVSALAYENGGQLIPGK